VKLRDLGEFAFIDRITPGCQVGALDHVVRGIGDDAAVVDAPSGPLVITTDMLIERVHFIRNTISFRQLGYKSLAVNLSDIAAMGATPLDAFLSIAVPDSVSVEELDELYAGMKELAADSRVNLLGGDTTGSKDDLCINVVVTGTAPAREILYRSGARVGDRIVVTGTLGDSAGGLQLLLGRATADGEVAARLLEAHYLPQLYLREARVLAASGAAGAAIDLSDGLASDLGHVCRRSGVGAVVEVEALPLSSELLAMCGDNAIDPVPLALGGGEDYRLMATVDPERLDELRTAVAEATGRELFDIGRIVAGDSIGLRGADGTVTRLEPAGWDHFTTPTSQPAEGS
jgi:thiamine-monophosphate kinase